MASNATGNVGFGAPRPLLSVPLLRRLCRRYRTWLAPALAAVMVMFSLSVFFVGPALWSAPPQTDRLPRPNKTTQGTTPVDRSR